MALKQRKIHSSIKINDNDEHKKIFLVSKLGLRIFFAFILKFMKDIIFMIKKWQTKSKIDLLM